MSTEPKLWIILGRPVRLLNALIATQTLREFFPGGCYLLRDESAWWDRANWQPYAKFLTGIHSFPRVKTCRGFFDLPRLYHDTAARKSAAGQLPIDAGCDILLCLASVTGLANAVASAHPQVYKILCISKSGYEGQTRHPDRMRFRFTTSGWIQNRIVEPWAGVGRTLNFKPRLNPGGDGVRLIRLQKEPTQVYQSVVCMSNTGKELPRNAGAQLMAARFPSITELPELATVENRIKEGRRVIFFGTPFLLIHNLAPDVYVEHLNRCLDYLRTHYPEADLIYRPHPIETKEASQLRLDRFRMEDDREAAELYFLRHFASIQAVYSVSSNVSRTAFNYGLDAYSLWRCFPFPETAAKFFEKGMGEVPPSFEIRDLKQSPVPYQASRGIDPGTRSFGEALRETMANLVGPR